MPYKDKEIAKIKAREFEKRDRLANPEKYKERSRRKYLAHQEDRKAYAREYRKTHRDLVKEAVMKWRKKNREKVLQMKRRWYKKYAPAILHKMHRSAVDARRTVLLHYGGKCSCCGESNFLFLTIEHKNGGGVKHRKEIGAANMSRFIIKNNFPDNFDVLCYNCNCGKAFTKQNICPHKLI